MDGLKAILAERGMALVGFADLAVLDEAARFGLPRAVSFCAALKQEVVAGIVDGPTQAYCREYDRANALLTRTAEEVAEWLVAQGWKAEARPATGDFDPVACRSAFPHKTAATLAGLGWIGRCALLITPQFGSAARWATVLTDAPLPAGVPQVESQCGDCTACAEVCPGRALSGTTWRQGMAREKLVDVHACLKAMQKVNHERDTHRDICGMCIAACPWTRSYLKREVGEGQ